MNGHHGAVRKGLGVEARSVQRRAVKPQANRILAGHLGSPKPGLGTFSLGVHFLRGRVDL
ncbi:hypothetical protein D3C77_417230 [compost metagenome]